MCTRERRSRDEFAALRLRQLVDLCFLLLCRVRMMHGTGGDLPAFLRIAADAVFPKAPYAIPIADHTSTPHRYIL